MADFVALYRGRTVSEAELVAVTAEPRLVCWFFSELLGKPEPGEAQMTAAEPEEPALLEAPPALEVFGED